MRMRWVTAYTARSRTRILSPSRSWNDLQLPCLAHSPLTHLQHSTLFASPFGVVDHARSLFGGACADISSIPLSFLVLILSPFLRRWLWFQKYRFFSIRGGPLTLRTGLWSGREVIKKLPRPDLIYERDLMKPFNGSREVIIAPFPIQHILPYPVGFLPPACGRQTTSAGCVH